MVSHQRMKLEYVRMHLLHGKAVNADIGDAVSSNGGRRTASIMAIKLLAVAQCE